MGSFTSRGGGERRLGRFEYKNIDKVYDVDIK